VDDKDERWAKSLKEEILTVDVPINAKVAESQLSLRQIRDLKVGDVLPIDMPESITLTANGVPLFRTKLGISNGNLALKVLSPVVKAKVEDSKFKFKKSVPK